LQRFVTSTTDEKSEELISLNRPKAKSRVEKLTKRIKALPTCMKARNSKKRRVLGICMMLKWDSHTCGKILSPFYASIH